MLLYNRVRINGTWRKNHKRLFNILYRKKTTSVRWKTIEQTQKTWIVIRRKGNHPPFNLNFTLNSESKLSIDKKYPNFYVLHTAKEAPVKHLSETTRDRHRTTTSYWVKIKDYTLSVILINTISWNIKIFYKYLWYFVRPRFTELKLELYLDLRLK